MGDEQPLAGARHAHVEQPPLLLERRLLAAVNHVVQRPSVRQQVLLHAHDEHSVELQSLRRVQGHERDGLRLRVPPVHVADQRRLLQEPHQVAVRVLPVVLPRVAQQHVHHFLDVLAFLGRVALQVFRQLQHFLEQVPDAVRLERT